MLTLIIPCYNEEKNLPSLLVKIEKLISKYQFIKIILVDNGSNDNSFKIISSDKVYSNDRFDLKKITKNIGYGHGILSGIELSNTDYISWTHADLQTDIEDVPRAYLKYKNQLDSNKKILIKGNRNNRNFIDEFFTASMSIIVSVLTFSRLSDINAQPKIFHRNILNKLNKPPHDFMLDLYLLIKAYKNKYKIKKYDVYFKKRKFGSPKGGGSLKGKIILSYKTINYLIHFKWK